MSRYLDDIQRRLQSSQGNDEPNMILKAYHLGYVDGLRAVFLAENLPDSFRNWIDLYFTRCDGWKQFAPLEESPPKVSPCRETITVKRPHSTWSTLKEKERIKRLLTKRGGKATRNTLLRSTHLPPRELDNVIFALGDEIQIEKIQGKPHRPATIYRLQTALEQ